VQTEVLRVTEHVTIRVVKTLIVFVKVTEHGTIRVVKILIVFVQVVATLENTLGTPRTPLELP
jgi:hypothetical protein